MLSQDDIPGTTAVIKNNQNNIDVTLNITHLSTTLYQSQITHSSKKSILN